MFGWLTGNKKQRVSCKSKGSYEVSIFLGCLGREDGELFFERDLLYVIGMFQEEQRSKYKDAGWIPVRVSPMTIVCGTSYMEKGWQVSAINYPRMSAHRRDIGSFMERLTIHLMKRFDQKRVTLVSPKKTVLYKNES
tara:strand:- start:258 stop:668 length:411 start_codon:yes stop_codon:yes gene_type:complete